MKKKVLSIVLAGIMVFATTACSGSQTAAPAAPAATTEEEAQEEATTEADAADSGEEAPSAEEKTAALAAERNEALGFELYGADGQTLKEGRTMVAENGVIASNRFEASDAGRMILEQGGNAVDAAVATGFALGVCEPMMSGLGGGGFMTIHFAETGEDVFIDFREVAPAAATPEMWQTDENGDVIDHENMEGGKSVGVPGEVAGLTYVLEKYGTMSLEEVMQPAIDLAENGWIVTPYTVQWVDIGYQILNDCPASAAVYYPGGLPHGLGDTIKNPDLAKTLRIIAEQGRDGFYKGEVAEAIVKAVQERNGLMTLEDLENYEITEREPVRGEYRGYTILSSPPPSSGGTHVIEVLNILENHDVSAIEVNSPEYIHLFSEAYKLAFADRAKYMGDPAYTDVPMEGLLSKEYAKEQSDRIDLEESQVFEAGNAWNYNSEHKDTNHYSVADKDGNMVSCTKTLNGGFGSGIMPDGYGFILNNEMGDFDIGAGFPNSIAPGKKPLSSMSPTIVFDENGEPFMVIGSPGGQTIICTVSQIISRVIDHGMDIEEAINTPRITDGADMSVYGMASGFTYESRIPEETIKTLEGMGHGAVDVGEWATGNAMGIVYQEDGTLKAAADPRSDSMVAGY